MLTKEGRVQQHSAFRFIFSRSAYRVTRPSRLKVYSLILQIRSNTFLISLHPVITLVPTSGTDFTILFSELQSINHAQHLINVTTKRQVINNLVVDFAILVDQKRTAESNTCSFKFNIVSPADLVLDVGNQGISHGTDTTVIYRSVAPGNMSELGINGAADDLNIT